MAINYNINVTHEQAKEIVIKNANLFYNGKQTEINDLVYDSLLSMIKKDEPDFDIYSHITYNNDGITVLHKITFRDYLKTADINSIDSEDKFNELRKNYYILPKFDGSSTVSYLNDGKITLILSRGDDISGFVNTNKLSGKLTEAMNNRFTAIHGLDGITAILSECVCTINDGGRAQANGLVNSKYRQDDVDKYAHLMPFDIMYSDGSRIPNIYFEIRDYNIFSNLRDNGVLNTSFGEVPCDGIVMYNRDFSDTKLVIKKLYYTEKKESTIRSIDWEVSWNSGVYHPVATFDTIELDGTNVSRATLFNWQNILNNKVGVGAKIDVIKANMTIPQIDKVKTITEVTKPKCPYCGGDLHEYGVDLICTNPKCSFWIYTIQYRLAQRFIIGDPTSWLTMLDNFYGKLFSNMSKDFSPNWYEELRTVTGFLDIAKLPRVGGAKYSSIINAVGNKVYETINDLVNDLLPYLSYLQQDYCNIISPAIEYVAENLYK